MLCERCASLIETELPAIDEIVFNRARHCVVVGGQHRGVGNVAWALLEVLWRYRPHVVSQSKIFDWLYGDDADGGPLEKTVAVHVCHVRKALIGSPYRIINTFGEGYRLESDALSPIVLIPSAVLYRGRQDLPWS